MTEAVTEAVIVALLSDFGTCDHYVGAMKGVVLSVCRQTTLVDITHDIAPQDVLGGALALGSAYRYFPAGTVFLAVVDPGVGSGRRAIAAEAGGYRFVGPDNGVLSIALADAGAVASAPPIVVELTEARFARPTISRTFEGRDRFAPVAGWLARGIDLGSLGPEVSDPVRLQLPAPQTLRDRIEGQVISVDRFGNLITNIEERLLGEAARARLTIGGGTVTGVVRTYGEAGEGELCALVGSTGHLEVAVRNGNAAHTLGARRGDPVVLRWSL